jgi:hypothetical protein
MGVTIHYRGRLKSADLVEPLVRELQDICDINNWSYTLLPDDFGERIADLPNIRGIMFHVHEECEPLVFIFNTEGYLRSLFDLIFERRLTSKTYSWISAKTQFAGAEMHIKVINLLLHLRKTYFKRMDIRDEGDYYPSKDKEKLQDRFDLIQNAMATISDVMEHSDFKSETPDEFVEEVRNAISKSFGNVEVRVIRLDADDLPEGFKEHLSSMLNNMEEEDDDDDEILGESNWDDLDNDN